MDDLIKIVNQLQDVFAPLNISCSFDLPQIAVVGEQSAGKSSVLENFVGRDFLPRGSGIVTRRPLILQLINHNGQEHGKFLHNPDKIYTDFLDIRKEIELETIRVTGNTKNISPIPINLRIYSPHVLNLTLIDLPGLTKVPIGDQPLDIDRQIRDLILQFISRSSCLILAVTPAITDLANSDALKLALEVDPERCRTIGVITKIDMMGEDTDCLDILNNKVYPLKRGFIGIVNRNQKDIEENKKILVAQKDEMNFFNSHPKYQNVTERLGTNYLQKVLNQQLCNHINELLPNLKQTIKDEINKLEVELNKNSDLFEDYEENAMKIILIMIQALSTEFSTALGYQNELMSINILSTGAQISQLMNEDFQIEVNPIIPSQGDVKEKIRIAIINSQGVAQTIFSPGSSFLAVIKEIIRFLEAPCLHLVQKITKNLNEAIHSSIEKILKQRPNLMNEVEIFMIDKINEYSKKTKDHILFFINLQIEYVNTQHPDFLSSSDSSKLISGKDNKHSIAKMEDVIYKQGPLTLIFPGVFKNDRQFYSVLQGQILIFFKDSLKKETVMNIRVAGCRIKNLNTKQKNHFTIFRKDGNCLNKTHSSLELVCSKVEDLKSWIDAFISTGVQLDNTNEYESIETQEHKWETEMQKHIEYVYLLVDSYTKISITTLQNIASKICVNCLILPTREAIVTELIIHLISLQNLNLYLTPNKEIIDKRKKTNEMYNLCKNALNIVNGSLLKADTIERKKGNILKKHSSLQNCYPIKNQKFDLPLPILSAPSPEIKSMDKKSAAKLVELAKKNFSAHKESRDNKLKIRTSSKEINFHQSEKNQKTAFWDIPDDATN